MNKLYEKGYAHYIFYILKKYFDFLMANAIKRSIKTITYRLRVTVK